jgi:6-phosphofructokinase
MGFEVVGLRRGWEGLTHLNFDSASSRALYLMPLNRENTRTIDRTGGSFLHSSRTDPERMRRLPRVHAASDYDVTPQVLRNIEALNLDYLIVIGGDKTLGYASRLNREGVPVIAIPKAMDNNVPNTEYCIGFSTAITRATDAIESQRTIAGSQERIGIFRIMGRETGHTALLTAYVMSLRCCIPECQVNLERLIGLLVNDKRGNPSNYALVILSEGAGWEQPGDIGRTLCHCGYSRRQCRSTQSRHRRSLRCRVISASLRSQGRPAAVSHMRAAWFESLHGLWGWPSACAGPLGPAPSCGRTLATAGRPGLNLYNSGLDICATSGASLTIGSYSWSPLPEYSSIFAA